MRSRPVVLRLLPGAYAVSRLEAGAAIPPWADGDGFVSISRTAAELSIITPAERVPPGTRTETGWRALELVGPFPFEAVGVAVSVLHPLAADGIGILLVATFDTDILLVKEACLESAADLLAAAGHLVER